MMNPIDQPLDQDWHWNGYSFRAMNTKIQSWLYSRTDSAVLLDVQRLFNSVEKRLSRFDPHSELSRLNGHPHERFQASSMLLDAVEVALWAAAATGGLYDPTILNALKQAGYDRSFELIEPPAPLSAAVDLARNGHPAAQPALKPFTFRFVQLNRPKREIYKPVGLAFDWAEWAKAGQSTQPNRR